MPRKDIILSLPGFAIKKVSGYNPLVIDVHYRNKPRCVHCDGKITQEVAVILEELDTGRLAYKFYCRDCRRYFNQQFPGIHKTPTLNTRLQNHIFHRHTEGASQNRSARF